MAAQIDQAEYLKEIEKARRDLRALISSKYCAPLMIRLAWNDAATYDLKTKTGGANGSIRNKQELDHGLKTAVDICQELKDKHPKITYADLYQLAGVVAVEIIGGPTVDFIPGRKDSLKSLEEGRLPDVNQDALHLRDIYTRMGLTDKDIVALSGVRNSLVKEHEERSDTEGQSTRDDSIYPQLSVTPPPRGPMLQPPGPMKVPSNKALVEDPEGQSTRDHLKFSNSYFKELLKKEPNDLLKVPSNKALVEDPQFRKYVDLYAKDEDAFLADYADSHKKLSELGFNPPSLDSKPPAARNRAILTQGAIGIAVATTMVILGFLFNASRRSN